MLWIKNLMNREYAIIKNDDGKTLAKKRFYLQDDKFIWNERTYNIIRDEKYRDFSRGTFLLTKHYKYYYNVKNSNPMSFNKLSEGFTPILDNKLYTSIMQAEILIKLNSTKGGLLDGLKNMDAKTIIGILMVLAVVAYFLTGGSLT